MPCKPLSQHKYRPNHRINQRKWAFFPFYHAICAFFITIISNLLKEYLILHTEKRSVTKSLTTNKSCGCHYYGCHE